MPSNDRINSGRFSDLKDGVEHSKGNKVLLGNLSAKLLYKGEFVMDDPHSVLHRYRAVLMEGMREKKLPEKFRYRPEAFSEYLYGTPDLWYLVLMANSITTPQQFSGGKVKYIPPERVGTVLKIADQHKKDLSASRSDPKQIKDRVLVPV
jgi:hypothetical protein